MERNEQPEGAGAEISVIGVGLSIEGNIVAGVDLQILGKVVGDVRCATLLLGEGGEVRGDIVAERVRLAGRVQGSISTGDLAVESTARVQGDVAYARIRIANGAVLHGRMRHEPGQEQPAQSPSWPAESEARPPKAQAIYIE